MERPHPATRKSLLRTTLTEGRVLTTAQLHRRDLLEPAEWLDLPRVTYTCRTRVTQSHSDTDLTFVALDEATLTRPPRELMHDAGVAEAWHRLRPLLPEGGRGRHVTARGRVKRHLPDAELLHPQGYRHDWAVEFDAGYPRGEIELKLEGAARAGYRHLVWATSIHARTRTVMAQARELHALDLLPGVGRVTTVFVDFWSMHDPYSNRPRCHKPMGLTVTFREGAGR